MTYEQIKQMEDRLAKARQMVEYWTAKGDLDAADNWTGVISNMENELSQAAHQIRMFADIGTHNSVAVICHGIADNIESLIS